MSIINNCSKCSILCLTTPLCHLVSTQNDVNIHIFVLKYLVQIQIIQNQFQISEGGKWNSHQMPCAYSSRMVKNYRICPFRIEIIHGRHELFLKSKVQEMWRHITGVEQPANKIKLDNNEKLERKRTYDQVKRKRKFQISWQKNRNWLVHKSEIDRMTCSVCIQYASSDRMMVTLVMMMFQVMTILTFFLHYIFFK